MNRLFERFRAARTWSRAYAFCVERRYQDAIDTLRSYQGPSRSASHWRLFEVYNLSLQESHVETLRAATALIDDLMGRTTLSENQEYFLAFARWCAWFAFAKLFPLSKLPDKFRVDPEVVRRAGVDVRWRRLFPLPERNELLESPSL